jgi:hypothetical protein
MVDLIISFDTPDLRDCCSSLDVAEQRLGSAHAQALVSLIADAEAFENANDLIMFFGSGAQAAGDNLICVPTGSEYRAIFVAVGVRFVRTPDGSIDWSSVQRLKLVDLSRCP